MRRGLHDQLPLLPVAIQHVHAKEIEPIRAVLDAMPQATA